ncbi:MAG: Jag N-terminal domain-containing protein [Clostridia bacterium]|nr:Jag N-terminal domain-containing protein [Clostridia bacterium]
MNNTTEQIGKTVEEAIRKGLEELKVARDDVIIEVLEEPQAGGVLGVLSQKLAKVRLTVDKKVSKEVLEHTREKVEEFLKEMFKITGDEDVKYTCEQNGKQVLVRIEAEDPKHLIGHKGKTIEALQSVLNSILQKDSEECAKVFLEINDYKKQKEAKLKALANKMARNVLKFKKPIRLEPMSAYERLIIHQELANMKDIQTESIGEEPRRRVVISRKYNRSSYRPY